MLGWRKHKLESRLLGEISITSDMQTTLMAESEEELKSLLMKVKEKSEQKWLKTRHSKKYFMASGPITSWQTDGEAMESVKDIIFLGSKITMDGDCSHETKRHLLLGRNLDSTSTGLGTNLDSTLPTKFCTVKLWFFH